MCFSEQHLNLDLSEFQMPNWSLLIGCYSVILYLTSGITVLNWKIIFANLSNKIEATSTFLWTRFIIGTFVKYS